MFWLCCLFIYNYSKGYGLGTLTNTRGIKMKTIIFWPRDYENFSRQNSEARYYQLCTNLGEPNLVRCSVSWGALHRTASEKIGETRREKAKEHLGKLNKRSFRPLIDRLQGPVTWPPACGFQLSADLLRNKPRQNDKQTLDRRLEILLPRNVLKPTQEVDRYRPGKSRRSFLK